LIDDVQAAVDRHGLMRLVGARVVAADTDRCALEVRFRDELSQQHGFFHAGVVGALLDVAGGMAGSLAAGSDVLTVEYKLNLLRPAKGDVLRAEASVVRAGRQLVVTRGDAFIDGTPCAAMQQTLMAVEL
jgi:uncharacterized protein (TIGR00369 family)